jgi:hypothetical protein
MATCSFLEACGDKLPINQEPYVQEFHQIVRLQPSKPTKSAGQDPGHSVKPDLNDLFAQVKAAFAAFRGRTKPGKRNGKPKKATVPLSFAAFKRTLSTIPPALIGTNRARFLSPPSSQPDFTWGKAVPLGLLLTYRQTWTPKGYSRGALLNSFSLAPGEELTLEVFNWDRARLEQERSAESSRDSTLTASVTGRVSQETVQSTRFKIAAGAETGADGSISLADFGIPADVGANFKTTLDTELETSIQSTRQQVVEATRTATDTLRSSRKTRVVESVERGVESRTTRKITNTNRCHALNFDIFEILECHDVTLHLHEVVLVVMVPLPNDVTVDIDWLLCHEDILRPLLPDQLLVEGFTSAKLIKAAAIFRARITQPPPSAAPTAPEGGAAPPNPKRLRLKPFVDAIVVSADALKSASLDPLIDASARYFDFDNSPSDAEWRDAMKLAGQAMYRNYIGTFAADLFDRVDQMEAACEPPDNDCETPLRLFDDYIFTRIIGLAVAEQPMFLGIPVPFNDAGLYGAIISAERALAEEANATPLPAAAAEAVPELNAAKAAAPPSPEDRVDEAIGLRELAFAQVELERLICHVRENLDRYLTAIFISKGPPEWQRLLARYPHALDVAAPTLLAVVGGAAVFPLSPLIQKDLAARNVILLKKIFQSLGSHSPVLQSVLLPTHGMTLESRLGECDSCESFIQQHRILDIDMRSAEVDLAKAKAELEAAEVARYQARLAASPPLLEDPAPQGIELQVIQTKEPGGDGG